ncbi:MAG: hypothetical protein CVU13_09715 [Bacteroidetes bacterium HGW-Bacteroidetes-8]|jgi:glycosyltransferase involved in cell wall biosynthesis|nr:MAG: hypothetical protein CVU13_09715 [Bacteroidetes bacterium HGW-Bacteroidetes-8]
MNNITELLPEVIGYILLSILSLRLIVSLVNLLWKRWIDYTFLKGRVSGWGSEKLANGQKRKQSWSILIPARDEELNIGKLLEDIEDLKFKPMEVIVFNDNSSDKTADIVESFASRIPGLRLVDNSLESLPQGWLGKSNACHTLAQFASGDYLLFLDADVRIGNGIAESYLPYAIKEGLSLLSVFPKQILPNYQSKIVTPVMNWILLSLLPLPLVRYCSWSSFSAANGQFMLFKASVYKELQPHKEFRMSRAEDIEISRYYKKHKERIATLTGDDSVRCMMYDNLEDAINGFSKNVFHFFGNSVFTTLLFTLLTTLTPLLVLFMNGVGWAFLSLGAAILIRLFVSLASEQSYRDNLKFMLHQQIVFLKITIRAIKNRHHKTQIWKGRNIY